MTEAQAQAKIAHLGFIQGVINRMGSNSFAAKGWCITLIAAFLALQKDLSILAYGFALIIVLAFWWLDAFFLRQERLFRKLYDATRVENTTDFSMNTMPYISTTDSQVKVMFSKTLLVFYGLFMVFTAVLTLLNCLE